jgi:hypothetical protein
LSIEVDEPINSAGKRPPAISKLLENVRDQEIPLFTDIGASCCDISRRMLNALGLGYKKTEINSITQVGGSSFRIIGSTVLKMNFTAETRVNMEFSVLEMCAVPIMLGLDVCQIQKPSLCDDSKQFS